MTGTHPRVDALLRQYARELAETAPSSDLDARIGELVATGREIVAAGPDALPVARARELRTRAARLRRSRTWRVPRWVAVAGFAALAITIGIIIGMRLEHRSAPPMVVTDAGRESSWPPAEFSMWPTDSVAFKVPAEYSADGRLVVVDPKSRHTGTRYWVDIVVSNDGTVRIEKVVPAGKTDGVTLQTP